MNIQLNSCRFAVAFTVLAITAMGYAPSAHAATLRVANCNDSGAGSLRDVVARAKSGDVVDLRKRRCTIVLTQGAIRIPQQDLALVGPGAGALTITSQNRSRILTHEGSGTVRIAGLSLVDGTDAAEYAAGGCIRSLGNVTLQNARVHQCTAAGVPPPGCGGTGTCSHALGGAIAANGNVRMAHSTVSDSHVDVFDSYGGGIIANELRMYRSRLLRNSGNFSGGAQVSRFIALSSIIAGNSSYYGGGVHVGPFGTAGAGSADVRDSAFIANETEEGRCAALCVGEARIVNSTFSGNRAAYGAAAIVADDAAIVNSTLTRNRTCDGAVQATTLYLESSILARNMCGTEEADLVYVGALAGTRNLVGTSSVGLPAGTLRSDPRLGPLAFNGGPTPTHALRADSPAIDRGSNPLALDYDQRGPGFPRVKGPRVDIGAAER